MSLGQSCSLPLYLQDDREGAEGSEEDEEEPSSPEAAPPPPPPKATGSGKKAAKKKKKAALKGKARAADDSDDDSEAAAPAGAADEEELDAILAEMNLQVRCSRPSCSCHSHGSHWRLLMHHGPPVSKPWWPAMRPWWTGLHGPPALRALAACLLSCMNWVLPLRRMQPVAGVSQPAAAGAGQQGGAAGGRPLLAVDMRQLKAEEELRRMFGTRVLEEEGEEGGGESRPPACCRPPRCLALRAPAVPASCAHLPACLLQAAYPPCPQPLSRCFRGTPMLAPDSGAYAGASRRVRRLAARGLLRRQALKPGAIINPRDTWPRFDGACLAAAPALRRSHRILCLFHVWQRCHASAAPGSPFKACPFIFPVSSHVCYARTVVQHPLSVRMPLTCFCAHVLLPAGGFSMEAQGTTPEGKQQFGYAYSQAYQASPGGHSLLQLAWLASCRHALAASPADQQH